MGAREATEPEGLTSRPALHGAVLAVGSAFVLASAFQGNVWFDEAYSVALAQHSWTEIWSIGANDVHPVLYYLLLHLVTLVFGPSIVAMRVFTALGSVALAALGATHLRRDFGARIGFWFSALALFVPAVASMAVQIRMYTWAAFAVALVSIYAWRIAQRVREGDRAGAGASVPLRWWVVMFASSAAAAHLHYFGAIAAFVACALLLGVLLAHRRGHGRELAGFILGAVCAVVCYVPWLAQLSSQISWVSSGFWIVLEIPATFVEILAFPLVSAEVILAWEGSFGVVIIAVVCVLLALAIVCWATLALHCVIQGSSCHLRRRDPSPRTPSTESSSLENSSEEKLACEAFAAAQSSQFPNAGRTPCFRGLMRDPAVCAAGVVLGVVAIAWLAGIVIDQMVLYYRYLYVCLGPALFVGAVLLARTRSRALVGAVCASTLVLSCVNLALLASTSYSVANDDDLAFYEDTVAALVEESGVETPLVVSADIGIASVLAVEAPDIPIVYLDVWGNGAAYEAFAPTIEIVEDWSLLDGETTGTSAGSSSHSSSSSHTEADESSTTSGFSGSYILLSTSGEEGAEEFAAEHDSIVVSSTTMFHPYYQLTFTISILERQPG